MQEAEEVLDQIMLDLKIASVAEMLLIIVRSSLVIFQVALMKNKCQKYFQVSVKKLYFIVLSD